MANAWHVEWLREWVSCWNLRRKRVEFAPDLSGINFFDYLPPDYRESPKTSRYFERIDLSGSELTGSNLANLNFAKANLSKANLTDSDLSLSNFSLADFTDANLTRVTALNAVFDGTHFERTLLLSANLEASNADRALLLDTIISPNQVLSLSGKNFSLMRSDTVDDPIKSIAAQTDDTRTIRARKEAAPAPKARRYNVFFGTNRRPLKERGTTVDFGTDRDSTTHYGICEILIPERHKIGSLGSPWWRNPFKRRNDEVSIEGIITLNDTLFIQKIREVCSFMRIPERPTLFVHGFNTDFKESATLAAQIGFDIGIGKGIGLFSWPSKGKLSKYAADEATVEASKYALADFIEMFSEASPDSGLNLIAHSMGCRCTMGAIEALAGGKPHILSRINQIILAAADIDSGHMPHIASHVVNRAKRVTSYTSNVDKALKLSGWLHSYPRVGVIPPAFVMHGIDTILVNNFDLGSFAHSYLSSSRAILADIYQILKHDAPPPERFSIESFDLAGTTIWRIKE